MLHRIDDPNLLASVLTGEGDFLPPAAVLDGLSSEQAHARPHSLPHSIAEIVAHMCFWQEWINQCAVAGFNGAAQHAADSWPAVPADGWEALRARFLESIEAAKRIVRETSLNQPMLPPTVHLPAFVKESVGSGILNVAVHNGHHLGQIITIRQLLGAWPPPGGSLTW